MKIAIMDKGQILTTGDLGRLFPNISFAVSGPDQTWLTENSAEIIHMTRAYDGMTEKLEPCDAYIEAGTVYGVHVVPMSVADIQATKDAIWETIRDQRAQLINQIQWRIDRWNRETRLGRSPTESISALDNYVQALCDITAQSDPFYIVWPVAP